MTSILWPAALPNIKLTGLQTQYIDPVIRTDMDAGPKKARLRYTAVPKKVSGTITVTKAQAAVVEDFYVNTLKYGTLRFMMIDPENGELYEYRFTQPPVSESEEGLFNVALALERM